MARLLKMYCCGCKQSVKARLTNGEEVYPHLPKLAKIPFWTCDTCKNFVGTHHKSSNPTSPLGNIATPEIKKLRILIHNKLDVLWKSGKMTRKEVYKKISDKMNFDYHTANIKHLSEAEKVLEIISTLK